MAQTRPIVSIENVYNNVTGKVPIGANGEDVFVTLTQKNNDKIQITLNDFAEMIYNYFKNGTFMYASTEDNAPADKNVKLWYKYVN